MWYCLLQKKTLKFTFIVKNELELNSVLFCHALKHHCFIPLSISYLHHLNIHIHIELWFLNILDMTRLCLYYSHPFLFYLFYTSHTFLKSCNLSKGLRATCHGLYFHNPHVVKHFIHVFMFVLTEIKEKLWGSFLLLFCPRVCLALTHKRTV